MNKRITINYLIGTFLITYIMWGIIIAANGVGYLQHGTPISMILYTIGGNAPPIAAYAVLKKAHKIAGIKQLAKEAFAAKQKPVFYAVLIAFLILYFGVPGVMQGISRGAELYVGILSIPLMILFGGLEELGWRYILQRSLESKLPFGIAASLTACIWAVWHLPLFFIKGTVQSTWDFGLFIIMVFGMSFALAAILYISKSIWLCILFHSMINALSSSWIIKDSIEIKICTAIAMIILSLLIVKYYKRKNLST
ncbi:CPBP family intramembrane glutamic endopeptidase [Clostridium polynesiense]|uniref:CPBP family intramembrane glutamic endopeptidase n=1 Tax=Clostridium polynesiense TaxID=1325933 RepID=UPI00058BA7D7|nr:type II CAAX endopeptidase family protein [Clostridium polynesiense]